MMGRICTLGWMLRARRCRRLAAVREAVADALRDDAGGSAATRRFAERIAAGGADDSEPMRIGLAVAAALDVAK